MEKIVLEIRTICCKRGFAMKLNVKVKIMAALALLFLTALYLPNQVLCWGNGRSSSEKYPYYGVHDAIAEYAYLKLKSYNETIAKWITDFYLNQYGEKWGDWGYSYNQGSDCWLGYTDDPDSYWRDWDNHVYEVHGTRRGAPHRIQELYNLIVSHLAKWIKDGMPKRSEDEHLAAYYAGMLSHYLADMSQIGHTDYTELDHSHPAYDPYKRTFHGYYESISITDEFLDKLTSDLAAYDFKVDVVVKNVSDLVIKLATWCNSHNGSSVNLALNHVVINEVELNPAGVDAGNEWVELYNPTNTAVYIGGWTIETTHGETVVVVIPEGVYLLPQSFYIVTYSGQWLDNQEESLILKDTYGNIVDATHKLSDVENNDKTWQRSPDGYDNWDFRYSTKGFENGGVVRIVGSTYYEILKKFVENYDIGISYAGARGYDEYVYKLTLNNIKAATGNLTWILYTAFVEAESKASQKAMRYSPDVNGDGVVDEEDLNLLSKAYSSHMGSQNYLADADLNGDGVIDIIDLAILGYYFE
ncbi:MAG: hypothetical protein DRJ31_05810 [Candidatus Methanomethylicota archaeon]|uniref:Dockerin domain-containing protein n=1 Tax=Thermoproteota archaeon TaxID=2056631 RepID=A0A497EQ06_9CREN|nr:MAG: hypothetical protein DRJ31_05810 [Candidatus Verstraetearchaeota archaeon]